MHVVTLSDGSTLLLTDAPPLEADRSSSTPAVAEGTLSNIHDLQVFLAEAVAAGITFDVLKATVRRLGFPRSDPQPPATAADVRAAVEAYFLDAGYDEIRIDELRRVGSDGWTVDGRVDGESFRALSDASAYVVHIQFR